MPIDSLIKMVILEDTIFRLGLRKLDEVPDEPQISDINQGYLNNN